MKSLREKERKFGKKINDLKLLEFDNIEKEFHYINLGDSFVLIEKNVNFKKKIEIIRHLIINFSLLIKIIILFSLIFKSPLIKLKTPKDFDIIRFGNNIVFFDIIKDKVLVEKRFKNKVPEKISLKSKIYKKKFLYFDFIKNEKINNNDILQIYIRLIKTYKVFEKENLLFTMAHGDFHRRNIMKSKNELYLIDWEHYNKHTITYDLVNFVKVEEERNVLYINKKNIYRMRELLIKEFNLTKNMFIKSVLYDLKVLKCDNIKKKKIISILKIK